MKKRLFIIFLYLILTSIAMLFLGFLTIFIGLRTNNDYIQNKMWMYAADQTRHFSNYWKVELLLKIGLNSEQGRFGLIAAAASGMHTVTSDKHLKEFVKTNLKYGADPSFDEYNVIYYLLRFPNTLNFLLKSGANPNARDGGEGIIPIMDASLLIYSNERDEAIEVLLKNGANPCLHDKSGKYAWDYALEEGHKDTAEKLKSHCPDLQ